MLYLYCVNLFLSETQIINSYNHKTTPLPIIEILIYVHANIQLCLYNSLMNLLVNHCVM